MNFFGAITRADLEFVAGHLGLQVSGSRLRSLQPVFEMVGTLGGTPIRALVPALPGPGIAVEVHAPLAPRLDLGLRVLRDQIDPYRPLSVEADEPPRAEALLGDTLRRALSPRFLKALLTDVEQLLDLSRRGEVTLNERRLTMRFPEGADPDGLLRDLVKAREVSRVLFVNGFGLSSSGRPYRT